MVFLFSYSWLINHIILSIINEIDGFIVAAANHSWPTRVETVDGFTNTFQVSDQLQIKRKYNFITLFGINSSRNPKTLNLR